MLKLELTPKREWVYCEICDKVVMECNICKSTSCGKLKCTFCIDDFIIAKNLQDKGLTPVKEGLRVIPLSSIRSGT